MWHWRRYIQPDSQLCTYTSLRPTPRPCLFSGSRDVLLHTVITTLYLSTTSPTHLFLVMPTKKFYNYILKLFQHNNIMFICIKNNQSKKILVYNLLHFNYKFYLSSLVCMRLYQVLQLSSKPQYIPNYIGN